MFCGVVVCTHGVLWLMNISHIRQAALVRAAAEETAAEAAGKKELHMGQMRKPNQGVQQCSTEIERCSIGL